MEYVILNNILFDLDLISNIIKRDNIEVGRIQIESSSIIWLLGSKEFISVSEEELKLLDEYLDCIVSCSRVAVFGQGKLCWVYIKKNDDITYC